MWQSRSSVIAFAFSLSSLSTYAQNASTFNVVWHAPNHTSVNDLTTVVNGTGVYGFIFNSSQTPPSVPYSTYNWCNMPHVRPQEYVKPSAEYALKYVEIIHRHHKRTPYASNTFPHESYPWYCNDESLFYYGAPKPENNAAAISWQVYTSSSNPLAPQGFNGTCQFPQITAGGLYDSRQHGQDLYGVYHDMLHLLPDQLDSGKVSYRVTNNVITSQVVSQIIFAQYSRSDHRASPVLVQPDSIDSLEPAYTCTPASDLYSSYGVGSSNPNWTAHLEQSAFLFQKLDSVSGIASTNSDWHDWFDHYFDNLSSRLCHGKPLPCQSNGSSNCVSEEDADAVFRRGLYEYSFIYRDDPSSLQASVGSFGIWMAELAQHFTDIVDGTGSTVYRHNVAHDGSISRLLSILQINIMLWPGMGSEVVFELYEKDLKIYLRVLWGGQILTSSNPSLGYMNMLPVETFLAYIDGLIGRSADKVLEYCNGT